MSHSSQTETREKKTTARVRLFPGDSSLQSVPVNTAITSAVYAEKQLRWQKMVNLLAHLIKVPACMIMQLRPEEMVLFASSESADNPCATGESYPLGEGNCCEAVCGGNTPILVEDAARDPIWQSTSFFRHMTACYGLPLTWPNGDFFGSLCVLDCKPNNFAGKTRDLIHEIHEILQEDLRTIQADAALRQKQSQHTEKIAYQETHDHLTDLLTPYAFKHSAGEMLPSRPDPVTRSAVGILNINHFKKLNQQYGYTVADQILQHVAGLLDKLHTNGNIQLAGRYAGDKFSFLLTRIHSKEELIAALQPLFNTLQIPLRLGADDVTIICTTGICVFPDCGLDIDELIMKADLIQSRAREKGGVHFYDRATNEKIQRELRIQRSLEQALHDGEITVHYQPQINRDGTLVSVEALVRWNSPALGQVFPNEFIPIAENINLIHELGLYIFETACRDIKPISFEGQPLKVSVNVSPHQFLHPDFYSSLTAIVRDTGIGGERIIIEITENVLLDDLDKVLPIFNALIECGFGLSIDDFGTGYSSLKYLSKLPLTEVKVDRSFINNITSNLQDQLLVKSVIAISDAGKIRVVAEGVETEKQAEWLLMNNCKIQQGWFYDKAMPLEQLVEKYTLSRGRVPQTDIFLRHNLMSLMTDDRNSEWDSEAACTLFNTSVFKFYVKNIFEFLLYIHADSGKVIGTSKSVDGLFQAANFDQFAREHISTKCELSDTTSCARLQQMTELEYVLEKLALEDTHTVVIPQQRADGSIACKKGSFRWLDRKNRLIIFSCIDITDVCSPPNSELLAAVNSGLPAVEEQL